MKRNTKSLDELKLNNVGIIERIDCEEEVKRRLLDMGLIKGTEIIPVLVSPSKDPRAFDIRGSLIAIRKEDAENIKIKRLIEKGLLTVFYHIPNSII